MPFSKSKHHAYARLLFAATVILASISPLPVSAKENEASDATLTIPGGFQAIARVAGLNQSIDPSQAVERLFRAMLESEPGPGSISGENRPRTDLISYLREYDRFVQYLHNQGLLPTDLNEVREIRFPLTGKKQEMESARKLLAFFGLGFRPGSNGTGDLSGMEGRAALKHKALFNALGIRLPDQHPPDLRLRIGTETLPIILDADRWTKLIPGNGPGSLLRRFLEHPEAMRLYLALTACSQTARERLVDSVTPARLRKYSEALMLFGSDLSFQNGELSFPGTRQSWDFLPGKPALSVNSLFSAGGIPFLFYSSLSSAPVPVQQYLTASPKRLQSYFEILRPYASANSAGTVAISVGQDLPRILRQLKVEAQGLVLDLGDLSRPLLKWLADGQSAAAGSGPIMMTPDILAKFLPRPGISPYSQASRADTVEFFRQLLETQPGSLSAESINSLMKSPEQAPVYLDLIGDLAPDGALLSRYLEYCIKTASGGTEGWNENRSRTSEAIFFLLSALRRERALSLLEANALLDSALNTFASEDEAEFVFNVADLLSVKLLPKLSKAAPDSTDALLSALAGPNAPSRISFGGRLFLLNQGARRYRRMQEVMQSQSYTPVPALLNLYALLHRIEAEPDDKSDEIMRLVSDGFNEVRTAESTPGDKNEARDSVAQIEVGSIKKKIESAGSWRGIQVSPKRLARQIAAELHTELGVTLLAYCYAYSATPDIHVLAFDPNFVRKHRFYHSDFLRKGTWSRSRFMQEETVGGFVQGSLAGLGFELTRLQIAQSKQDFGISSNVDIAPAILYGIRQVRPELRTDRSQQYVAVATKLGNEMVSLAGKEESLGKWIEATLSPLASAQRIEEMRRGKSGVLSRSELFLLGHTYFNSREWDMARCPDETLCPAVANLIEIVPKKGSVEYNAFREEVSQYGVFLGSRIGLSRFSFEMIDSYERLQKNLRPEYLYDRMCDLKIRIAELNYSLGLPASLGEIEADEALRRVLPPSAQASAGNWRYTIDRISGLTEKAVPGWINELTIRGSLDSEPTDSQNSGL